MQLTEKEDDGFLINLILAVNMSDRTQDFRGCRFAS